jgi:hypothetical protein
VHVGAPRLAHFRMPDDAVPDSKIAPGELVRAKLLTRIFHRYDEPLAPTDY